MLTPDRARILDSDDPGLGHEFVLADGLVYLDGNSLGALARHVPERMSTVVRGEWGEGLIGSWNTADWVGLAARVGDRIGRIIGAGPGTVSVGDSTSVNLYKAASAAMELATGPHVLLTDDANFPSDGYVLSTLAERSGWELRTVAAGDIVTELASGVGVLSITQVDYRTGDRHDLIATTAAAREAGVVTVWDLAHSAGAFDVAVARSGADFAVGCGYKYLNGGPGAPGFLYAAPHVHAGMRNPITGWFGHRRPFDFASGFEPATGIERMRVGTSPILGLAALDAALDVFDRVVLDDLWARGVRLVDHLLEGFGELGLDVVTPVDAASRGSQVSFRHPDAYAIVQALIDRDVVGDFRTPDVARFGVAALYVDFEDIAVALERLRAVLAADLSGYRPRRGPVT